MTDKTRPPPIGQRERHRAATHARILLAARKIFEEKGYHNATTESVLREANISRATLYQYFDTKRALMSAVNRNRLTEAQQELVALIPILLSQDYPALRGWVRRQLQWLVANRAMALAVRELMAEDGTQREVKDIYLDYMEPWVSTWPVDRQDEARMRLELSHLQTSNSIWGAIDVGDDPDPLLVDILTQAWWDMLVSPLQSVSRKSPTPED